MKKGKSSNNIVDCNILPKILKDCNPVNSVLIVFSLELKYFLSSEIIFVLLPCSILFYNAKLLKFSDLCKWNVTFFYC
jgi:hypothetical protein